MRARGLVGGGGGGGGRLIVGLRRGLGGGGARLRSRRALGLRPETLLERGGSLLRLELRAAQALGELERIFDFTTDALLRNCKGSMNYLKTKQLNLRVARGGAGLTLTGRLGEAAIARGNAAVAAVEAKADAAA